MDLLSFLIEQSTSDDIILDFFAGSGTTAHAVMELNAEDGGTRQSISVQYPEPVDEKSEAYKAGYRTIADITRARIQKVIEKLQTEHPEKAKDLACAHFTLAPSNFKIWQTELDDGHALRSQLEAFQDGPLDSDTSQDAQRAKLSELFLKLGLGALGVHAVNKPKTLPCGITIHRVMPDSDRRIFFCFEPYQDVLKDEVIAGRATQLVLLNACFQGSKADEQLSNLKLELAGLDIDLVVI